MSAKREWGEVEVIREALRLLGGVVVKEAPQAGELEHAELVSLLSAREWQVFQGIARGETAPEMTMLTGARCSVKTIESHLAHIRQKLRLRGIHQLRLFAVKFWLLGYRWMPLEESLVMHGRVAKEKAESRGEAPAPQLKHPPSPKATEVRKAGIN